DRGCAVPGCHWPAAWCELHHIKYWSQNGKTSTENGVMICAHHHQALHAKMLQIERVNGDIRFKLHPMIDPDQEARKNYFWQNCMSSKYTSVINCALHHKALQSIMLHIERVNGEIRFKLHPMIDPAQEARKNYFWQN